MSSVRLFLFVWIVPLAYIAVEVMFNVQMVDSLSKHMTANEIEELRNHAQLISSFGMFVAAMAWATQFKKPLFVSVLVATALSIGVFSGQRHIVEYAIEKNGTEQALENAKTAYIAKVAINDGIVSYDDFSNMVSRYPETVIEKDVFSIFLPSVLLLHDDKLDVIRAKQESIARSMVLAELEKKNPSVFSEYKTSSEKVDSAWRSYNKASKEYLEFNNGISRTASKAWDSLSNAATKKHSKLLTAKREFRDEVNTGLRNGNSPIARVSNKIFSNINRAFANDSTYARCISNRYNTIYAKVDTQCVSNPAVKKSVRLHLGYASQYTRQIAPKAGKYSSLIRRVANDIPNIKAEDWCRRKIGSAIPHERVRTYTRDIGILTSSGKYERRLCPQPNSSEGLRNRFNLMTSGFPAISGGYDYDNIPSLSSMMRGNVFVSNANREISNKFGFKLPKEAYVSKSSFVREFKRIGKAEAKSKFKSIAGDMNAGLFKNQFMNSASVQGKIRAAVGVKGLTIKVGQDKKYFDNKILPKIVNYKAKEVLKARSAEESDIYLKAAVIPVIAVTLSLFFLLANSVLFLVNFLVNVTPSLAEKKRTIEISSLVTVIAIPMFFAMGSGIAINDMDIYGLLSYIIGWSYTVQIGLSNIVETTILLDTLF